MTTVTATLPNDLDDGFDGDGTLIAAGYGPFCGPPPYVGFMRFASLAVPQGVTVTSASVTATIDPIPTAATTYLTADAADNSTRPSEAGDITGRTPTTAKATWVLAVNSYISTITTTDLSAVIQEIISRPGWVSGNALTLLWTSSASYQIHKTTETLTVTYTTSTGVTATAANTIPKVTQSAAVTVTVPSFTATASNTIPAVTQSASGLVVNPFTITATVDGPDVAIGWDARDGATGYAVERDGALVAFNISGTSYTDTPGDGEHTYRVGVIA